MITAEELIEDYMERYEVGRLEAIKMALEDIESARTELQKERVIEIVKKEGEKNNE